MPVCPPTKGTPCRKCGSTFLYRESDRYGSYIICGHCGRCSDQDTVPSVIQETILTQSLAEEEAELQGRKARRRGPSMARLLST